jgi:hypothetical protein
MAERTDDAHEAPDGLPEHDTNDGLPHASNDAHRDHRADDHRLVSDTSHRYPEPSSDDVPDDPHRDRDGVSPLLAPFPYSPTMRSTRAQGLAALVERAADDGDHFVDLGVADDQRRAHHDCVADSAHH